MSKLFSAVVIFFIVVLFETYLFSFLRNNYRIYMTGIDIVRLLEEMSQKLTYLSNKNRKSR